MENREVKKQRRTVDWSELPKVVVLIIGFYLLPDGSNYRRFRGVCRKWRKSSPPSTHFLCATYPRNLPTQLGRSVNLITKKTCLLFPIDIKYIGIFPPWLVTVEELNPGKLVIRHPLTGIKFDLNDDYFPKTLNLFNFRLVAMECGYKLCHPNGDEDVFSSEVTDFCRNCPIKTKTLYFGLDSVAILSLDQGGILGFLNFNGEWRFSELGPKFRLDDIEYYNENICAVSHGGQALLISSVDGRVIKVLCTLLSKNDFGNKRKLLAVYDDEVYLIVRKIYKFWVFKMNEELQKWERVYDLGDKVLFVTYDKCFFVNDDEFHGVKGNCIVFPKNCFPTEFGDNSVDDELFQSPEKYLELGVFYMNSDNPKLMSPNEELSDLFWPPPEWLNPDSDIWPFIRSKEHSKHGDDGQGAENPPSTSNQKDTHVEEVVCENNDVSVPATNSLGQDYGKDAAEKNIQGTGVILDLVPHNPSPKLVNVDSLPLNASAIEITHDCASLEKFQGIDVSSNLVPVLQKIWDKHGNIIKGHIVQSNSLLTWALESLANMIIILQKNTGDSLNNSQADYLNSTLADLQLMKFRLDWLVPFVERAVAVHKSKCQKAIMINLETRKSKLLAEMHELEEQMVQQEKLMAESLMNCAPSVLEKGLAEGLC
uniref:KIB1-4 beta-propeller domain-containing protein n=1 Tax=Chenopodium quinoa TaxID=63459 RepID=A0A803L8B9_CHEQI